MSSRYLRGGACHARWRDRSSSKSENSEEGGLVVVAELVEVGSPEALDFARDRGTKNGDRGCSNLAQRILKR